MNQIKNMKEKIVEGINCPYCNGKVLNLLYSYGCENSGIGGACNFYIEKTDGKIQETDLRDLVEKGRTRMIPKMCYSRSKERYYDAALTLNAKGSPAVYSFDFIPPGDTNGISCPYCGGKIIASVNGFSCEMVRSGECGFYVSRYGGKLTVDDLKELVRFKKTRLIEKICFSKRKGKRYSAHVILNPKGSEKTTSFEFPHRRVFYDFIYW